MKRTFLHDTYRVRNAGRQGDDLLDAWHHGRPPGAPPAAEPWEEAPKPRLGALGRLWRALWGRR